jgi:hypothetical protein
MSWINFDTDPPTPMEMEDGEPTPLVHAQALKCSECNQWYIHYTGDSALLCSPGCAMVHNERLAGEKS